MASFPTNGDDVIFGTDNADNIDALAGDDLVVGGAGNDSLSGGVGDDMLAGGFGLDTLIGGRGGSDTAFYGFYADDVKADLSQGVGYIKALGQAADGDTFSSIENLSGGFGDDELRGDKNNNILSGNSGDDLLDGREGDDTLNGGNGNDTMFGNGGTDAITGGAGDDLIRGGAGGDQMSGGTGIDTLDYSGFGSGVTVSLLNNSASGGDAAGDTISGFENLNGSPNDDTLGGTNEANTIQGGDGSDKINGLGGKDLLRGLAGDDTIRGGAGDDSIEGMGGIDEMTGGGGADRFFFSNAADSGVGEGQRDIIKQFQQGSDKIYIGFDAIAATVAFEDFTFIGTDAFTFGNAGTIRYSAANGITVISFNTDNDTAAEFQIEIDASWSLTAADFVL